MVRKDDRTPEQMSTHRIIIAATDKCLSGWGAATGGTSVAAWACRPEDAGKVEDWVRSRSDMARVRVVFDDGQGATYRPRCKHLHIYTVEAGHPALS